MPYPVAAVRGKNFGVALPYNLKVLNTAPANLIGYWMLDEAAGTSGAGSVADSSGQANHATPTAVTFGTAGIGDGKTAASFDGATSYVSLPVASLTGDYNGDVGTAMAWLKVRAASVWGDGATRDPLVFNSDSDCYTVLRKSSGANALSVVRRAGGANVQLDYNTTTTAWFHMAVTWTQAGNSLIMYINGAPVDTGDTLAAWAGTLDRSLIGAVHPAPVNVWDGLIAHVAAWKTVLSPAQILALATATS